MHLDLSCLRRRVHHQQLDLGEPRLARCLACVGWLRERTGEPLDDDRDGLVERTPRGLEHGVGDVGRRIGSDDDVDDGLLAVGEVDETHPAYATQLELRARDASYDSVEHCGAE